MRSCSKIVVLAAAATFLVFSVVDGQAQTILDFDFSAVLERNSFNPVTATSTFDANLKPFGTESAKGLEFGTTSNVNDPPDSQVSVGELAWDNNFGSPDVQGLDYAFANDRYIGFTIEPKDGYRLNLAGEDLVVNWYVQQAGQSPRDLSLFTTIGGFSAYTDAVETKDNIGGNNSYHLMTFTLPGGSNYDGITDPFEVRIYFHDAVYNGKLSKVNQLTLNGEVEFIPPEGTIFVIK